MKKQLLFCLGAIAICIAGCQKKETVRTSVPKPEKDMDLLKGQIVHLYKDTVYILSQTFMRNAGEQLIIDGGTLIKVDPGTSPSIIINAGALIEANGSRENPIVFTSAEAPGNQDRNWGGITITGKSVNNGNNPNGDATDISGALHFVRIEFAGLKLNAVGNRTIVENVMVSYASQSSFIFQGGRFAARNLVSYACGGPADYYISEGYSGRIQFVVALRHPFFGQAGGSPSNALAGIFVENHPWNAVDARPYTYPVISNAVVIGPNAQNGTAPGYNDTLLKTAALVTTGSTGFAIRNSVFMGYPLAAWQIGDSLTAYGEHYALSELTSSVFHSNDRSRVFYLAPGTYPPFHSIHFEGFMLQQAFNNQVLETTDEFMLNDPFNYEAPGLLPKQNSPLLTGAGFDGTLFSDPFFTKVPFRGALGTEDWLSGWTNFTPLKTNYNYPR